MLFFFDYSNFVSLCLFCMTVSIYSCWFPYYFICTSSGAWLALLLRLVGGRLGGRGWDLLLLAIASVGLPRPTQWSCKAVLWLLGPEVVGAGAAAQEGGPHGWLFGKRRSGGDGFYLWLCGWRGADARVLVLAVLQQRKLPYRGLEVWLRGSGQDDIPRLVCNFFRMKAQHFGASSCNAFSYCNPPRGAVAVTFVALGLQVKTLDYWSRRRWRNKSLPSWGWRHGASVSLGRDPLLSVASSVILVLSLISL
jgi:hypothetical protein